MDEQGQFAASDMIESLSSWWALAGVDAAVSNVPVEWLALDVKPEASLPAPLETAARPELPVEKKAEWPQDIEILRAMIAGDATLPGNAFSNGIIVPVGPAVCELMVVSDLPDPDELTNGKLGSGASGKLLERMLAAIGIRLADCYWTAFATTIPAAGALPDAALPELADFVRHQISLVDPKQILLVGSVACRALLGAELMEARGRLGEINYIGGKKAALTTFHPRTLLARPQMKAQAWKDLQMLAQRANL
ncbi:MAG: uracil-DNA glycosylase [Sphingorhabdus sp.]